MGGEPSRQDSEKQDETMLEMIDEARQLNERAKKRAAGAKFFSELIGYITEQSAKSLEDGKQSMAIERPPHERSSTTHRS